MTLITSKRATSANRHVLDLQTILAAATGGAIGVPGSGAPYKAEKDLTGLIRQTEVVFLTYQRAVEIAQIHADLLRADLSAIVAQLDVVQDALANLVGNIDYDEAMDHAAADLMDCIAADGTADINTDGNLVFAERTVFSKEDMKPMLREAIVRWVELKMSQ